MQSLTFFYFFSLSMGSHHLHPSWKRCSGRRRKGRGKGEWGREKRKSGRKEEEGGGWEEEERDAYARDLPVPTITVYSAKNPRLPFVYRNSLYRQ